MNRWPDEDPESGSILLAMMLMLILAGLGALLLASTLSESKSVQHDQKFTDVLPAADAAINEGLFRLNHPPATGGVDSTLPLSTAQQMVQGSQTANWTAQKVTPSTAPPYYVFTATTQGLTRTVKAEAYQSSRFAVAAFAETSVVFRGDNSATSYNSNNGNTNVTGNGRLGSDGSITFEGNATADGTDLYNWTQDPNASRCSGTVCTSGYNTYGPKLDLSSPSATQFISAGLANCAQPLQAYSTSGSGTVTLPSGTWCASSLDLNNDITLTGPTTIYVSGDVTMSHHLNINYSSTSVPVPANLQIYMLGSSYDMANHTTIAAAIYAPLATCDGGAQSVVYGSLICGSISNVGGWQFHYDDALATLGVGDFRIRHYREN